MGNGRLSRPSFATQHPLPSPSDSSALAHSINPAASLAYPSKSSAFSNDTFVLSPLLTLPPAFGNAYVGETFSCTLCANNEVSPVAEPARRISGVRIEAEMKTPSLTGPLDVAFSPTTKSATDASDQTQSYEIERQHIGGGTEVGINENGCDLASGQSLQGIVEFHLKEEGSHVLAVTVSYTETGATSGKVRSFRKLYQFVARGCLVVRTKIGPLAELITTAQGEATENIARRKRWALEAQLENCGEEIILLDMVALNEKPWCVATGLNWDVGGENNGLGEVENPMLAPGDVQQICFLVEERGSDVAQEVDSTGRLVMGMLSIGWRGAMGNRGSLSTGWLGTRLR
jgi:trafficking protein particle complex subunit 13